MIEKKMETLKAGKVDIGNESPIWHFAKGVVAVFGNENSDMIVIDTKWLREDEDSEDENCPMTALAKALDACSACEGWREVDLLYVFP